MLTLLFDGIAYGMLLFVLSLGLAVTMGLMNFINLAHGELMTIAGYALLASLLLGFPFPIAVAVAIGCGAIAAVASTTITIH